MKILGENKTYYGIIKKKGNRRVEEAYLGKYDTFPDKAKRIPNSIEGLHNKMRLYSSLDDQSSEKFERIFYK